MENRKEIKIVFWGAMILFVLGIVLLHPDRFGVCGVLDGCVHDFSYYVGQPLLIWTILFILSLGIVFFFKGKPYKYWRNFFIVYVIMSIIWIINTPVYCGGSIVNLCLDKKGVSWLTAILFFIITLVFGVYSLLSKKTENGK